MLKLDPSKRPSAVDLLEDPYFGDISDLKDEPGCTSPFCIEHEIDDLPVAVLKRKILTECLHQLESKISTDKEQNLFEDFDADFISDFYEVESDYCKEKLELETRHFCQDNSEKPIIEIGLDNSSEVEDCCPSITNLMNDTIPDEPYRDPGCCQPRRCSELSIDMDITEDSNSVSSEHSSVIYPRASPLLDFEPYKSSLLSQESELSKCRNIIEEPKSKNELCLIELNREILNRLNGLSTKNSCGLSEVAAMKRVNNLCASIHWDQIRLWI